MKRIGFCFEVGDNKKFFVIFVSSLKVKAETIVGFEQLLPKSAEFKFLKSDLTLGDNLVLDNFNFIYSKISLSEKKVLDYSYNMFWFSTQEYKEIWSLLKIDSIDQIPTNTLRLLDLF